MENMFCRLPKQQTVIFDFGEVRLPPITADWSFDVQADNKLNRIQGMLNRALTKNEAIEIAVPLNKALHLPLEQMIDFVTRYPESSTNSDVYRASVNLKSGVQVGYYFQHRFRDDKPLSIVVKIEWNRPLREIKPRREPIKPPPGFENVSMEPQDDPIVVSQVETDASPGQPPTKSAPHSKNDKSDATISNDHSSWPMWLLLVIAFAIGVAAWLRFRKSKP